MTATGWLPLVIAVSAPFILWLLGVLRWPRDVFWLVLYLQMIVYLFLAPNLATRELGDDVIARYEWLEWWLLALLVVSGTLLYLALVRRLARGRRRVAPFRLSLPGTVAVAGMSVVLALGYLQVAFDRNLLYRRIGWEGLAEAQLQLSLFEFGVYRSFIELGPFLIAVQMLALRTAERRRGLRTVWIISAAVTFGAYGLYALMNSRLSTVLLFATVGAVLALTAEPSTRWRPERLALALAGLLLAVYGVRVAENVRYSVASGGSALEIENFLLFRGGVGGGEEAYYWRLNGVDIMAQVRDNVEAEGPALGALWAVPALLALDPIVRTSVTEDLKRATLTNAKVFMLLRYAGVALPDYYSCMAADAYGNFGRAGFLLVGVTLALLTALATWGVLGTASPVVAIVGVFAATRMLQFEQDFATLLFGWLKLAPFVALVLLARPLRRASAEAAA